MTRDEIVKKLQFELKAADAAQELFTSNEMSAEDKLEFQFYEGRISLLQELLVDIIAETAGI